MATGITRYSDRVEGDARNYKWPVSFDVTDGFLGITQMDGDKVKDRILLSPKQVKDLIKFAQSKAD